MITRKNRDVKFIIYQSLYIFVISVLALKGANLDLTEVVSKEKIEEKNYTDSLKSTIDSLLARGIIPEIKFDTNMRFSDPEELKKQLAKAQQELTVLKNNSPTLTLVQTSPNISQPQINTERNPEQKPKEEKENKESEAKQEPDFKISQSFTQYTSNTVSNPSNVTIEIIGSDGSMLASVPPGGSRTFQLGGQSTLTFKSGGTSKTITTKQNAKPKITLQRLVQAGEEVSVRSLQSTVGYRLTITDDFPGQLEVSITGPVTFKQAAPLVYDITLNYLNSKTAFDNFTENRDPPYNVTFQVVVKDKLASHSVAQTGVFQFGEW